MTPQDVDRCSFRDLNAMITGARQLEQDREKAQWHRSLIQTQAIINGYAKRQQPLDTMYKKLFDTHVKSDMTLEEYHEKMKEFDRVLALRRSKNGSPAN